MSKLKAFDKDVIKYLEQVGVSAAEIKRIQAKELKAAVLHRLKLLVKAIEKDNYVEIREMSFIGSSPAGDGMGCDNALLDFSDLLDEAPGGCALDIMDVVRRLQLLKSKS